MAGRDPAERRLWALTLIRLLGLAAGVFGLVLLGNSGATFPQGLPGLVLMLGGLVTTLAAPRWLKRWRQW